MARKDRESQAWKPSQNEEVMCTSKGIPYKAKVLQLRTSKELGAEYYVHYKGWNKNWDEWVTIDRISRILSSETQDEKIEQTQEPPPPAKELKFKIPDELKDWLIDDDNNIKNKKLTVLPAKPPIATILKDFVAIKKSGVRNHNEAQWTELTLGIKDYFNVMLGSHLLYKFERLQYQQLLEDQGKDVDLANHYGVIHLARLFTKMGLILAQSTLESQDVKIIFDYVQELLKHISKQATLFDNEKNYFVAPPDYIKNGLK